jgi:hypothetical protein
MLITFFVLFCCCSYLLLFVANLKIMDGYGKKSGGQRKRMDLAIFFALIQLQQQRTRLTN